MKFSLNVMEEDSSTILDGEISGIRFGLATRQEICIASVSDCPISHASQLTNPFLGLPLEFGKCESCGTAEPGQCEGHFGYIELPIPIYHPGHVSELKRMLSLLCLKCLKIRKSKVTNNGITEQLLAPCCQDSPQVSVREFRPTEGACFLELKIPSRSRPKDGFWDFLARYGYRYGHNLSRILLPSEVMEILRRIPEDTRKKLVRKGYFPQDGYILQYLPVPPNCLSVPDISDGVSIMSSDLSVSMLKKVLKQIEVIKGSRSGEPNFESHKIEANNLQSSIEQYLEVRGTAKTSRSLDTRFGSSKEPNESSTKAWLEKMRTLFIRKGSGFSSRSVITGDAYKRVNEIGLPFEIAQRITFEERVNVHNMKHLQNLVDEKLCLTYRDGLSTYSLREGSKGHTFLRPGQVVHRRIMDGDIVFINRPPTTHKHSLQALSVYVHDDHTVKINPLICGPLSADFDGDCVHLFYPQSLGAKAEVLELFSVEKQLLSSHSGNLNLQLATDSLLSLKVLFERYFLNKAAAQQLVMFVSMSLPRPALLKSPCSGPCWTALQILQTALPSYFDCIGERHWISKSAILKVDYNRDVLQSLVNEIVTSIFSEKGPNEVLKFFDSLQPLLMENLFSEGFSVSLEDFSIPREVTQNIQKNVEDISSLLYNLRSMYNELLQLQAENHLRLTKVPVANFILNSSALGNLIDSKSDSAINKVVQQIGFLGQQLSEKGKFYSRTLVEGMAYLFKSKYPFHGADYPSGEFGLVRSCFFHGLDPYEEMVHSISTREIIVRSSRGLSEPGTLFKNLMAILRDVVICYDGTVRNVCSNSIIQFEYGVKARTKPQHFFPAGEPVGVLAATAMSNPAYKAVLDSSPSSNSSWELMKEILLCQVNFKNDLIDRRVILYLNDCDCGRKYCRENAAYLVKNQLKKASLKDTAVEFMIEYVKQHAVSGSSEPGTGLVGHIHLNKLLLQDLNVSMQEVCQKCEETINSFRKKKNVGPFFKKIILSFRECCSFQHSCQSKGSDMPCLLFFWQGNCDDNLEQILHILAHKICPVLLQTIIKGDSRVCTVNIIWISPDTTTWIRNPCKSRKGELALDIVLEKAAVKQRGDAWRIVLDACLPVLHLIDTRRSIPYAIKQVQELLGISCAFDQAVQRLSKSVTMVAKGVLKEHLILLANSMTCAGNLIGFNSGGYKALSRALNLQVPFTEATLFTPRKCFEKASEKCHTDSLSSIVASCSWGKHVTVGTGSRFDVLWDTKEIGPAQDGGIDIYSFLHLVRSGSYGKEPDTACLGAEVEDLILEDENLELGMSPEHSSNFEKPVFEDSAEFQNTWENHVPDSGGDWAVNQNKETTASTLKPSAWSSWGTDKVTMKDTFSTREPEESSRSAGWDDKGTWGTDKAQNTAFRRTHEDSPRSSGRDETFRDGRPQFASSAWGKKIDEADKTGWNKNDGKPQMDKLRESCDWDCKVAQEKTTQSTYGGISSTTGDWKKNELQMEVVQHDESPVNEHSWDANLPEDPLAQATTSVGWDSSTGKDWTKRKLQSPSEQQRDPAIKSWSSSHNVMKEQSNQPASTHGWDSPGAKGWNDVEEQSQWNQRGSAVKNDQSESSHGWGPSNEQNQLPSSQGWGSPNAGAGHESETQSQWGQPSGKKSRPEGSRGWGSNNTEWKNKKNRPNKPQGPLNDDYSAGGIFTATRQRVDIFTSEEQDILLDVEPIMQSIRRIMHQAGYNDGDPLSADDQSYILDKVFNNHPDKAVKMGTGIDYVMVSRHSSFLESRCFYVVSTDGHKEDFSYRKCLENFIKEKYPDNAETFIGKYFRRPRAGGNRERSVIPEDGGNREQSVVPEETGSENRQ